MDSELKDMPPILDGERSLTDALAERIEELRAQERFLQHLILFARYAELVGDDLFETLAFGTSEVDAFAELMRSSPAYADKAIRWESMDDAGLEQLWDELGAIIVDFLGGDDEDPFAHIESTVRRLRAWFCTYFSKSTILTCWAFGRSSRMAARRPSLPAKWAERRLPVFCSRRCFSCG